MHIFDFISIKRYSIFTNGVFQGIIQLEKELAYLGSVCAAALMKKDLALPIGKKGLRRRT